MCPNIWKGLSQLQLNCPTERFEEKHVLTKNSNFRNCLVSGAKSLASLSKLHSTFGEKRSTGSIYAEKIIEKMMSVFDESVCAGLLELSSICPSFWTRSSQFHLTCPKKRFEEKVALRSFLTLNMFGLLLSGFWEVCQHSVLRAQRNVFSKTMF